MFPEGFKQRIKFQEYIDSEALLKALDQPSQASVRVNLSKWNRRPENSEQVPWCKSGYYLEKRASYTFDPLFHAGCYYPQEASGMFLEKVFRQCVGSVENIKVLDLCGAPGGKSTHLSSMIGADGLLVANEVIKPRASILTENMTRWGLSNVIVTQNDPVAFGKLPGFFDVILVDAPCSGEGMFRDKTARKEWSEENAFHCSVRQKRILTDIWEALKENGLLIYSTCTFNPAENEQIIKWLLEKHAAEGVSIDISEFSGITEIDYNGIKGYGFYPDKLRGEGLFISVIRKTSRSENRIKKIPLNRRLIPDSHELRIAMEWTDFPQDQLLKSGTDLVHVPGKINDILFLFQNLRITKSGTKICSIKNRDYLPSHEIALSAGLKKRVFPSIEVNYNEAIAFLKRDEIRIPDAPEGWFILEYKGINLGFLKNIGMRINNYFPVASRIRMNINVPGKIETVKWEPDKNVS